MSKEQERQSMIDRYINNQMASDEQEAFERAIQEDNMLANDVALNQDMEAFLNSNALDLEEKLDSLGQKHFVEGQQKPFELNRKWGILAIFLVALLVIGISFMNDVDDIVKTIDEQQPTIYPIEENITPKTKEKTPFEEEETSSSVIEPIAEATSEDYKVNPILESILQEQTRDNTQLLMTKIPDFSIKYDDKITFAIGGKTTFEPPYELIIYSNKESDFNNDYRILSKKIKPKSQNSQYLISFEASLSLQKGLYYYLLKDKKNDNLMYINRFSVK